MDVPCPTQRMRALRSAIDAVDDELGRLLASRAHHAIEIGELKRRLGLPVRNGAREAEVHRRLTRGVGPLAPAELSAIMGRVIEACRRVQEGESVACLGPEGSFSEQAAQARFGGAVSVRTTSTITEVFESVAAGTVAWGIVPADNTRIGPIAETRAALQSTPGVRVREAVVREIELVLAVRPGCGAIRRIHSKPEALEQCRGRLEAEYEARWVAEASTSAAARAVAQEPLEHGAAALTSVHAAQLAGLEVRSGNLVDGGSSSTVFWVLEANPTSE